MAGEAKTDRLPIKRTGPSFPAAINAALVVLDGVHSLVWSRGNGPKADLSGQPARRSGGAGAARGLAAKTTQLIAAA